VGGWEGGVGEVRKYRKATTVIWKVVFRSADLRPVYTGDFCCDFRCDFLLLGDVKEWTSYKCSRL
jgi:hypothetical protein